MMNENPASLNSMVLTGQPMLNKVPQVTICFWTIKVLATTVGETAADYLNVQLNFGLTSTSIIMSLFLLIALFCQFKARQYIPKIYWLTVVLLSVVGTLITDKLTDNLGVPLAASTAAFSLMLLMTFVSWYASEKTLSIHSIYTTRREGFYWLAILFTFALGTAAGDFLAETIAFGYLNSAFLFSGLIAFIALAYYRLHLGAIPAFWTAYILTRPLGASLGDYLSQPAAEGGIGLGVTVTSIVFLGTILSLVIYLTKIRHNELAANTDSHL